VFHFRWKESLMGGFSQGNLAPKNPLLTLLWQAESCWRLRSQMAEQVAGARILGRNRGWPLGGRRRNIDCMAAAGGTLEDSSSLRWLRSGKEGLEAMLDAVARARSSVRLETYIFDNSPIGVRFLEALVSACGRQVKVRVLVDALGSVEVPDSFWQPLREAGGQVRWFNPLALRRITYRDHRKILVVDDRLAVVGGFNIASEYYGDGVAEGWRDLGLEVEGPLAAELAESVDLMFAQADFQHKRLHRLRRGGTIRAAAKQNWQLLLSGPGRGHRLVKHTLAGDLAGASCVLIMSAYFFPTWRIRRELQRAARRGAQVRLILAGRSDVTVARLASRRLYQGFLRAGVEIWEYQPQVLHAKLIIVDDVVYAGSLNLDARGLGINYEVLIRVKNPALAASGREMADRDLAHCHRILPAVWRKSRGLFEKILEALSFVLLARLDPYLARWQWRRWGRRG
jgi:cardiolipin synthase A/B